MTNGMKNPGANRLKHLAAFLMIVAVALAVAWGANSYYGGRRMGQEVLLPRERGDVLTYAAFNWAMYDPADISLSSEIKEFRFAEGKLRFRAVADTFADLNLAGEDLSSIYHFLLHLNALTTAPGGMLSITLTQTADGSQRRFVSERIALPEGAAALEIDLGALEYRLDESSDRRYRWGEDLRWADGLRFDFDHLEGTEITIYKVLIRPGLDLRFDVSHLWSRGAAEGVVLSGNSRPLRLERENSEGVFTSGPVGLGSLQQFIDFRIVDGEGEIKTEIRSGDFGSEEIDWGEWLDVREPGDIGTLQPRPFVQFRFSLSGRLRGRSPRLRAFELRYLDPTPPGLAGPLFGAVHLPTLGPGRSLSQMLAKGGNSVWVRLPFDHPQFEETAERLIGADVNLVGSVNLDAVSEKRVEEIVGGYRGRIKVWELYSPAGKPAPSLIELFHRVRLIDPSIFVIPERAGSDYFQRLAARGLSEFAGDAGSAEEVLDRGFGWYFVMALLGLFLVVGLGPVAGYNFRLGPRELAIGAAGLAASAAVLIPIIPVAGLAELTLPRDLAQVEIAFNRFAVSALLQEFVRALIILLPVRYLTNAGMREKRAWLLILLGSSVLFGLGHLGYPGLTQAEITGFILLTSLAGLILGAVFYATRSLTVIAVIHLLSNVFLSTMTTIGPGM